MKFRTIHNRIERREFEFTRADVLRLLQAEVLRYSAAPAAVATVTWELVEDHDDTEGLKGVTLVQAFEYLSPASASVEAGAGSAPAATP